MYYVLTMEENINLKKKSQNIFPANFPECVRFFIDTSAETELFFINLPNREEWRKQKYFQINGKKFHPI